VQNFCNRTLDDRFRVLTSGSRTALPRHQTLLAAIDWSYQLLSEPERMLLRRLAVFAGGWTLEAAEAVCADVSQGELDSRTRPSKTVLPGAAVLDRLSELAAKSLVVSEPTPRAEARFHLLETIRDYARQKLNESGEAATVRQRHLDFFLAVAERAEPELQARDQVAWFDRLDAELDNLRAALAWAAQASKPAAGLRLASALHHYWDVLGYWNEGYHQLKRVLAVEAAPQPSAARALALAWAAHLATAIGDFENGAELCRASLALSRGLGPAGQGSAAQALLEMFWIAFWQYRPEAAQLLQESLAKFEKTADDLGRAWALQANCQWALYNADYLAAARLAQESLVLFEQAGDHSGTALSLALLGTVARRLGEYNRARDLAETALAHFRQLGDRRNSAYALRDLGDAYNHLGLYEQAMAAAAQSVALMRSVGGAWQVPRLLNDQSQIATRYGDYERATRLLEESRRLAVEMGQASEVAGDDIELGSIARARGDPARARDLIETGLSFYRSVGSAEGVVYNQPEFGRVFRDLGEYEQAGALITASLDWFQLHGNLPETAWQLLLLGGVARRQGDHSRAASRLGECLAMCKKLSLPPLMASCLAELAYLYCDIAQAPGNLPKAERAARLLGASEALCQVTGLPIPPADQAELGAYNRAVLTMRTLLGEERFSAVRAEGRAMGMEEAATYGLAGLKDENQPGVEQ
jgi:tetratricopeptide (TPR) repeat protein